MVNVDIFTWDFFCCSDEGKSSIHRLNKVKRLTLESLGIWPVIKRNKKIKEYLQRNPHCWSIFSKPSRSQLPQMVHPLLLLLQLNPHCPLQGSSCKCRTLTSGCRDRIRARRSSSSCEAATEIQSVNATQRWRAETTDHIPHNFMCSDDSQMLTEIWDRSCASASGPPRKRAEVSRHTWWS